MNKQELIGHVADRAGLTRNDAMRAVETMLERGAEVAMSQFNGNALENEGVRGNR